MEILPINIEDLKEGIFWFFLQRFDIEVNDLTYQEKILIKAGILHSIELNLNQGLVFKLLQFLHRKHEENYIYMLSRTFTDAIFVVIYAVGMVGKNEHIVAEQIMSEGIGQTVVLAAALPATAPSLPLLLEIIQAIIIFVFTIDDFEKLFNINSRSFYENSKQNLEENTDKKAKVREKAISDAIEITKARTDDDDPQIIYRTGSGNATNLTPRPIDLNGLSYQLTQPTAGKFTITSIEAVNATKILFAKIDGIDHASVNPVVIAKLKDWIDSRPTALTKPHLYTKTLIGVSIIIR